MLKNKAIKGILVAPWAIILWYAVLFVLDPIDDTFLSPVNLRLMGIIALLAYLIVLLFLTPVYFLLRNSKHENFIFYLISGLVIGFLVAAILDLPHINIFRYKYYVNCTASIALAAITYWYVTKKPT